MRLPLVGTTSCDTLCVSLKNTHAALLQENQIPVRYETVNI
jgi:hypothetical protein